MKKVFRMLKGREIIFVSLLTLIIGGVGGFFIGRSQSFTLVFIFNQLADVLKINLQ